MPKNPIIKPTTFCEICRDEVAYTKSNIMLKQNLKGIICEYPGKKAICNQCQAEVWIPAIHDSNLESLINVYQNRHTND